MSENHHREGILRLSLSRQADPLQQEAEKLVKSILDELDYVGVLALELFQVGDKLFANEMAPRVHNSGHWTIEGAVTSQFENHLRAISNMPLGETTLVGPAAMINIVGQLPSEEKLHAIPGSNVNLYGKSERPGRKIGHVTLIDDLPSEPFKERLSQLLALTGEDELANKITSGEIAC